MSTLLYEKALVSECDVQVFNTSRQRFAQAPPGIAARVGSEAAWAMCRAQGSIDQVAGLIHFDAGGERLLQWDVQIQAACSALNSILDSATTRGLIAV